MLKHLHKLWDILEIRLLVVSSLGIQILLLLFAGFRKHVVSIRFAETTNRTWRSPLGHMFHWFLWLAYLLADYVATVGLAYLRKSKDGKDDRHLIVFWAPFFLLHLGGQDTITALSIEDNELWSRHLLTLLSQTVLALYNYFVLNLTVGELWPPAALMFAVGSFKYVERIWALQHASMSALRSSMITKPDPGPNYAKIIQEHQSSRAAGIGAVIILSDEDTHEDGSDVVSDEDVLPIVGDEKTRDKGEYARSVRKAYKFFQTFKRLFVDLILSYKDRQESQRYFRKLNFKEAYEIIEIELSWMYDMLHSKASVIYTIRHYGWVSRVITLIITSASLILFATLGHKISRPWSANVVLTYVLLVAAVGMEVVAIVYMLLSLWTYAVIFGVCEGIANFLFSVQLIFRPRKRSRWSNKMAQFSLITYALKDKPRWWKPVIEAVGFKHTWDNYRYATFVRVSSDLKDFVFKELKKKVENARSDDSDDYMSFTEHRGQWALQRKGYYKEFGWSVEAEFDESILLWHIATDLLSEDPGIDVSTDIVVNCNKYRTISKNISNYMMFLLIGRPFMMPAGIGQIRFGDTAAEATNFFESEDVIEKAKGVKKILEVNTDYDPVSIKGDRSKSLLFTGCRLAHGLKDGFKKGNNWDRMWILISSVWVEMLCYAAGKCSGQFHARQLSKGGELLTVVWFLMAHLGMGEQYRIKKGHKRAQLIVSK